MYKLEDKLGLLRTSETHWDVTCPAGKMKSQTILDSKSNF